MNPPLPITEDDLEGFVDDVLDAAPRAAVQTYLDGHPEEARRIAAYEAQRRLLRDALRPIAEEPVPVQLGLARLIEAHRRPRLRIWSTAAAAAVVTQPGRRWRLVAARHDDGTRERHRRIGAGSSNELRGLCTRPAAAGGTQGGGPRRTGTLGVGPAAPPHLLYPTLRRPATALWAGGSSPRCMVRLPCCSTTTTTAAASRC